MSKFSFKNRAENLISMKSEVFDLLVVGGGITGAGVAREASIQGLKVALVEQNDFSSGTSSRSSKLAHGGLRYLENFEFGLVAEALRERHNLLKMAPHMVEPLQFMVPIYKQDRVGWLKMKMGMILYDFLSFFRTPGFHRSLSKKKILNLYPRIKREGLVGGFLYYDANMEDDRLVHETLKSACLEGAKLSSYVSAKDFSVMKDLNHVQVSDALSGESFEIKARHVVSCVGPWTDDLALRADDKWKPRMRPSKGVHLCVKKHKLKLNSAVVMAADKESRILFCIPKENYDIIGTTDTDFNEDPGSVRAKALDVDYIKKVLKDYFPQVDLEEADILSTYAGVRPLVNDGSKSESKVSRSHWVHTGENKKITYISGGKYTTYLAMAEDVLKEVVRTNASLPKLKRLKTRQPLVKVSNAELQKDVQTWLSQEDFSVLVKRYGLTQVEKFIRKFKAKSLLELEVLISVHEYCCGSLSDFLFRRVDYALTKRFLDEDSIDFVLQVLSQELGYSSEELQRQKQIFWQDYEQTTHWKEA